MTFTADNWPMSSLAPASINWWPSGGIDSGGVSLSGLQQLDSVDGGPIWKAAMLQIPVWKRDGILAFQAMQMILATGPLLINVGRMPDIRAPVLSVAGLVPHHDGTPFADETLYQSETVTSYLSGDHDLRQGTAQFTLDGGRSLIGGEDFSIEHDDVGWRMYRVMRVNSQSGDVWNVDIGPTLRDDVSNATALEWDNPRCVMRLADQNAFNTALMFNRWGFVDVQFEEAFF